MIFSEVKNITVSQGDVKKINLTDNTILYEYVESLVCNPVVGISLSRDTSSTTSKKIKTTSTLSGISNSLITDFCLLYIEKRYLGTRTLSINTPRRTKKPFSITDLDTVNGIEKIFSLGIGTRISTVYVFRSYIKYTNLNGSIRTAYSDQVEASYNSLA